jgi:hypothetical protein
MKVYLLIILSLSLLSLSIFFRYLSAKNKTYPTITPFNKNSCRNTPQKLKNTPPAIIHPSNTKKDTTNKHNQNHTTLDNHTSKNIAQKTNPKNNKPSTYPHLPPPTYYLVFSHHQSKNNPKSPKITYHLLVQTKQEKLKNAN